MQAKLCSGKFVIVEARKRGFYSLGKQRVLCHNLVDLLRHLTRAFDNVSLNFQFCPKFWKKRAFLSLVVVIGRNRKWCFIHTNKLLLIIFLVASGIWRLNEGFYRAQQGIFLNLYPDLVYYWYKSYFKNIAGTNQKHLSSEVVTL